MQKRVAIGPKCPACPVVPHKATPSRNSLPTSTKQSRAVSPSIFSHPKGTLLPESLKLPYEASVRQKTLPVH